MSDELRERLAEDLRSLASEVAKRMTADASLDLPRWEQLRDWHARLHDLAWRVDPAGPG